MVSNNLFQFFSSDGGRFTCANQNEELHAIYK